MKYIWLFIMVLVVLRSIRLLVKRSRSWGKPDAPWDDLSFNPEDMFPGSSPVGEPGENKPGLNLPEYPTRQSDDTSAGGAIAGYEGMPEELTNTKECRLDQDNKMNTCREHHVRHGGAELYDGMVCPGEFFKGMVWSQILGSRGGLQAKKRFKQYNFK